MGPITLSLKNNHGDLMNATLTLSDKRMYKKDPMFSYYNIMTNDNNQNKGQLQIVVSDLHLPIGYAGNGAVLVKLRGKDNQLLQVLKHIEEQITAAAPTGVSISPLVKQPDQDTWHPSFKLKSDKCAIHKDSRGTLQQGCVLERCLITVSKLNHYQGKWYYACYLKSAHIGMYEMDTEEEEDEESLKLLDDLS